MVSGLTVNQLTAGSIPAPGESFFRKATLRAASKEE